MNTTQEEIYSFAAKPVIESKIKLLNKINIFKIHYI